MHLIIKLIISIVAIMISAYLVPGVNVDGYKTAALVAIVLGVLNFIVKPLLLIFTLPINILTLGLFTFVINALLILLVTQVVTGFSVDSFFTALLFSLVLSVVETILNTVFGGK